MKLEITCPRRRVQDLTRHHTRARRRRELHEPTHKKKHGLHDIFKSDRAERFDLYHSPVAPTRRDPADPGKRGSTRWRTLHGKSCPCECRRVRGVRDPRLGVHRVESGRKKSFLRARQIAGSESARLGVGRLLGDAVIYR